MNKLFNTKWVVVSLVLVSALSIFTGCGQQEAVADEAPAETTAETPAEATSGLEGTVAVVGSTSVTPVAQKLAEAFTGMETAVQIDVQGVGSTAGVKSANDGSANIGMASRNLKEGEKEWGLTEHVIAYDGIAVVVHPSNNLAELTTEKVTQIFKAEITNWNELGGPDKEIIVVSREAGSGTRGAFEGIMKLQEKNADGKKISVVTKDALIADGNGAVKANVASKEFAIGYVSLSYLDESVKGLLIDGAEPTVDAILEEEYKVSRPFLMLTKGDVSEEAQAYLDFIFSTEGQEIVAEKLIPVQ